jgi:uncharacterized Zn-finger protein
MTIFKYIRRPRVSFFHQDRRIHRKPPRPSPFKLKLQDSKMFYCHPDLKGNLLPVDQYKKERPKSSDDIVDELIKKATKIDRPDRLTLYICSTCNKNISGLSGYKRHCLIHTGAKPYECRVCKKKTNHKYNHLRHEKFCANKHGDDLNNYKLRYECDICYKRLSTRMSYDRHMRIHSGVTPFKCKHCGTLNTDYSNNTRHEEFWCHLNLNKKDPPKRKRNF